MARQIDPMFPPYMGRTQTIRKWESGEFIKMERVVPVSEERKKQN
jgi:hypothetical protein